MTDVFASRTMFIKIESQFYSVVVSLGAPKKGSDNLFYCKTSFSIGGKYDALISGVDEINAVDCAMIYIKGVIEESVDPKFYWDSEPGL